MKGKVKYEGCRKNNPLCNKCKGSCWVEGNQKKTQENAMQMFGVIPNSCVNSQDGEILCPYPG